MHKETYLHRLEENTQSRFDHVQIKTFSLLAEDEEEITFSMKMGSQASGDATGNICWTPSPMQSLVHKLL